MAKGELVDERGQRMNSGSAYRVGGCLFFLFTDRLNQKREFLLTREVLYQDENILVADKPHFLPVVPAGRFSMKRC